MHSKDGVGDFLLSETLFYVLSKKQIIVFTSEAYNLGKDSSNCLQQSIQDNWLLNHPSNCPVTAIPLVAYLPLYTVHVWHARFEQKTGSEDTAKVVFVILAFILFWYRFTQVCYDRNYVPAMDQNLNRFYRGYG